MRVRMLIEGSRDLEETKHGAHSCGGLRSANIVIDYLVNSLNLVSLIMLVLMVDLVFQDVQDKRELLVNMARMDLKESGDIGHSLRRYKGIIGEPGLRGFVGQPGMPGLEELQDFPGAPGPKGYRGEPGISAGSKKEQLGEPGLPGFDDRVGPKGLKHDSGLAGFDGLPGPRGERGDTDESGLRGLLGPEGPQHRDAGADGGDQSLISFGSCLEDFGVRPFIECRGFGSCNYFATSYWLITIHDENMFRKPLQQTLKADHTSRVSRCAVCLRRWVIEVLKPFMSNNERAPNNWGVALPAPPPSPRNLPDYESSRIPPRRLGEKDSGRWKKLYNFIHVFPISNVVKKSVKELPRRLI